MIVGRRKYRASAMSRELARSPILLRLKMLELSAGLRSQTLPREVAEEVRISIKHLRSSIMANPALSLADFDAKSRTAMDARLAKAEAVPC